MARDTVNVRSAVSRRWARAANGRSDTSSKSSRVMSRDQLIALQRSARSQRRLCAVVRLMKCAPLFWVTDRSGRAVCGRRSIHLWCRQDSGCQSYMIRYPMSRCTATRRKTPHSGKTHRRRRRRPTRWLWSSRRTPLPWAATPQRRPVLQDPVVQVVQADPALLARRPGLERVEPGRAERPDCRRELRATRNRSRAKVRALTPYPISSPCSPLSP